MKNKLIIIFFIILFVVIYIMNELTPVYILDDTNYAFHSSPEGFDLNNRIINFKDVIITTFHHWFYINGRIFTHFFVALFAGLLGKPVFNIFNAFAFCLMAVLTIKLTHPKYQLLSVLFFVFIYFLLIPSFCRTSLWMAGSINYLWSAVFTLFFFHILNRIHSMSPLPLWRIIVLVPIVFMLGWIHECFALPVAMSMGIYVLYNIRTVFKQQIIFLIFAYALGAALTCFSIASLSRLSSDGGGGGIKMFLFYVLHLRLFWINVFISMIVWVRCRSVFYAYMRHYGWLCLTTLFSLVFYFLIGRYSERIMFGTEFFSLLLLFGWFSFVSFSPKTITFVSIFLLIANILLLYPILSYQKLNHINYKRYEPYLLASTSHLILTPSLPPLGNWSNYIVQHVEYGDFLSYMASDSTDTDVKRASAFFHKKGMRYFPMELYNDIFTHPERYKHCKTIENCGLYARELSPHETVSRVQIELRHVRQDEIPIFIRPISDKLTSYTINTLEIIHFTILSINHRRYLVFAAPEQTYASRIKHITVFFKKN